MVVDVTLFSGETGEPIVATAYDGDLSRRLVCRSQWTTNFPGFDDALHCATEGSRVAVALSPDDMAEGVAQGFGLAEDDTAIAVIDLRKVYLRGRRRLEPVQQRPRAAHRRARARRPPRPHHPRRRAAGRRGRADAQEGRPTRR